MFSPTKPVSVFETMRTLSDRNQLQSLKASGNQPRSGNLSPNVIASAGVMTIPGQVSEVRAIAKRTSDQSSTITVTFSRNPNDYQFVDARVFVSGYKGNPQPVQVASGQSPVSFALDNTGEPISIIVQASGNLGQANLSNAPSTTLQLRKTALATTPTPSGNGPSGNGLLTKTNHVANSDQTVLDLVSIDGSITLTESAGVVDMAAGTSCSQFWGGMGDSPMFPSVGTSGRVSPNTLSNTLGVILFKLNSKITVSRVLIDVTSQSPNGKCAFGLYTLAGNLLFQAQYNATDLNVVAVVEKVITPVFLKPAQYYFAYSSDALADADPLLVAAFAVDRTQNDTVNAVTSGSGPRIATAANGMVSGALPATLGALSALDLHTLRSIPICLFAS